MKRYKVIGPVWHRGVLVPEGTEIEFSERQAKYIKAHLEEVGVTTEADRIAAAQDAKVDD